MKKRIRMRDGDTEEPQIHYKRLPLSPLRRLREKRSGTFV
jgi:hypothetical protein